ncbi:MAG: methyltransferase domain-containing protein [Deltaproteobacteria bacterium]|nr:methyltransferase domain-containing protein [Deltaproteobacteria bacterium]
MSQADRDKWNRKFGEGSHTSSEPSSFLVAQANQLPTRGRALDIAGGVGRNALWLAERGLEVTIADNSDVGLLMARERATEAGLTLHTELVDLEQEPLPDGPWDLVTKVLYMQRSLFATIPEVLRPGGLLVCIQPTVANLERHAKPPRPHLLLPGELREFVQGLEIIELVEDWSADGYHDACVLARKPD